MTVTPRPISGPINSTAFLAGFVGSVGYTWYSSGGTLRSGIALGAFAIAGMLGTKAAALAVRSYKLRCDLHKAKQTSGERGSAREATLAEMTKAGMTKPETGMFVGLQLSSGTPLFVRAPWSLVEAPPGVGKTINFVVGEILHRARLGQSLFIPDIKGELTPMLAPILRALGFEVWCIDPAKTLGDEFNRVELNVYQPVLDAVHASDEARQDAVALANDLANMHLPEEKGGDTKNVYFNNGSRRCIAICILALALLDPGNCTPSALFALLNDPERFQQLLLSLYEDVVGQRPGDPLAEYLASEAANLLSKRADLPENFQAFLEGATQTLLTFNRAGRLAGYGSTAISNINEMRKRQIITFMVAPLAQQREFTPLVSLLNAGLIDAVKRHPEGHTVHVVGEEALNYQLSSDFSSQMETLRGLCFSATLYIQSFQGLSRKYGKEAADSIDAYSDVRIFAGINSFDRARRLSDLLASETVYEASVSGQMDVRSANFTGTRQAKPLMTPDEILSMPRDEGWMIVSGMRPIRLKFAHYGQIIPWNDEVGANPLAPTPLRGETLVELRYPEACSDSRIGVTSFARPARKRSNSNKAPWLIRPRDLIWVPALAGLWLTASTLGTPHLRYAYEAFGYGSGRTITNCSYLGLQGVRMPPPGGRCALITLIKTSTGN